ncbi:starch binding domain-containing protein [Cystoisospora suis]|uniref:Starch binding domain-containing protein n=1 Tax=Cystoisospora suis TaxID=483139 RepID=A0A2C6L4P8_9APIC|nr:starch binding domain-containing protein [Cystoisospora suis]
MGDSSSSSSFMGEGDLFCPVSFHCHCTNTSLGEQVCVLGSSSSLGKWSFSHRVRLVTSPETFPLWHTQKPVLLPAYSTIRYKFLICNRDAPLCKACRRPASFSSSSSEQPPPHQHGGEEQEEDLSSSSLSHTGEGYKVRRSDREESCQGPTLRPRRNSYEDDEKANEEDEEQASLAIGIDGKRNGVSSKPRRGSVGRSSPPSSLIMPSASRLVLGDEGMRNEIRCCGAVMRGELEAIKKWESIRGHQGDRILQLGNEPLQVFDTFEDTHIFLDLLSHVSSFACLSFHSSSSCSTGAEPGPLPPPIRRPSPPKRFARVLRPATPSPRPSSSSLPLPSISSSSSSSHPECIVRGPAVDTCICPSCHASPRCPVGAPPSLSLLPRASLQQHASLPSSSCPVTSSSLPHQDARLRNLPSHPLPPSSSSSCSPRSLTATFRTAPAMADPSLLSPEVYPSKTSLYLPTARGEIQQPSFLLPSSPSPPRDHATEEEEEGVMRTRRSSMCSICPSCSLHSHPDSSHHRDHDRHSSSSSLPRSPDLLPLAENAECSSLLSSSHPPHLHTRKTPRNAILSSSSPFMTSSSSSSSTSFTCSPRWCKSFVRPLVVPPLNTAALLPPSPESPRAPPPPGLSVHRDERASHRRRESITEIALHHHMDKNERVTSQRRGGGGEEQDERREGMKGQMVPVGSARGGGFALSSSSWTASPSLSSSSFSSPFFSSSQQSFSRPLQQSSRLHLPPNQASSIPTMSITLPPSSSGKQYLRTLCRHHEGNLAAAAPEEESSFISSSSSPRASPPHLPPPPYSSSFDTFPSPSSYPHPSDRTQEEERLLFYDDPNQHSTSLERRRPSHRRHDHRRSSTCSSASIISSSYHYPPNTISPPLPLQKYESSYQRSSPPPASSSSCRDEKTSSLRREGGESHIPKTSRSSLSPLSSPACCPPPPSFCPCCISPASSPRRPHSLSASSPLHSSTFRAAVEAMTAYYPAHGLDDIRKDSVLAGYSPRHRYMKKEPPPIRRESMATDRSCLGNSSLYLDEMTERRRGMKKTRQQQQEEEEEEEDDDTVGRTGCSSSSPRVLSLRESQGVLKSISSSSSSSPYLHSDRDNRAINTTAISPYSKRSDTEGRERRNEQEEPSSSSYSYAVVRVSDKSERSTGREGDGTNKMNKKKKSSCLTTPRRRDDKEEEEGDHSRKGKEEECHEGRREEEEEEKMPYLLLSSREESVNGHVKCIRMTETSKSKNRRPTACSDSGDPDKETHAIEEEGEGDSVTREKDRRHSHTGLLASLQHTFLRALKQALQEEEEEISAERNPLGDLLGGGENKSEDEDDADLSFLLERVLEGMKKKKTPKGACTEERSKEKEGEKEEEEASSERGEKEKENSHKKQKDRQQQTSSTVDEKRRCGRGEGEIREASREEEIGSAIQEPRIEEEKEREKENPREGMAREERILEGEATKVDVDDKKKKDFISSLDRQEAEHFLSLSSQRPTSTRWATPDTSAVATAAAEAVVSRLEQRLLDACNRGKSRSDREKPFSTSSSSRFLGFVRPRGVDRSFKRSKASSMTERRRRRKYQLLESPKHLGFSSNRTRPPRPSYTSPSSFHPSHHLLSSLSSSSSSPSVRYLGHSVSSASSSSLRQHHLEEKNKEKKKKKKKKIERQNATSSNQQCEGAGPYRPTASLSLSDETAEREKETEEDGEKEKEGESSSDEEKEEEKKNKTKKRHDSGPCSEEDDDELGKKEATEEMKKMKKLKKEDREKKSVQSHEEEVEEEEKEEFDRERRAPSSMKEKKGFASPRRSSVSSSSSSLWDGGGEGNNSITSTAPTSACHTLRESSSSSSSSSSSPSLRPYLSSRHSLESLVAPHPSPQHSSRSPQRLQGPKEDREEEEVRSRDSRSRSSGRSEVEDEEEEEERDGIGGDEEKTRKEEKRRESCSKEVENMKSSGCLASRDGLLRIMLCQNSMVLKSSENEKEKKSMKKKNKREKKDISPSHHGSEDEKERKPTASGHLTERRRTRRKERVTTKSYIDQPSSLPSDTSFLPSRRSSYTPTCREISTSQCTGTEEESKKEKKKKRERRVTRENEEEEQEIEVKKNGEEKEEDAFYHDDDEEEEEEDQTNEDGPCGKGVVTGRRRRRSNSEKKKTKKKSSSYQLTEKEKTEEYLVELQQQISTLGVSLYEVRREQAFARQILAALCGSLERALDHTSPRSHSPCHKHLSSSSSSSLLPSSTSRDDASSTREKEQKKEEEEREERKERRTRRTRGRGKSSDEPCKSSSSSGSSSSSDSRKIQQADNRGEAKEEEEVCEGNRTVSSALLKEDEREKEVEKDDQREQERREWRQRNEERRREEMVEEGRKREDGGGWSNEEEEKEGEQEEVEDAPNTFEIEGRKGIVQVYKMDDVSDLEGRRSSSLSLCELSSSSSPSVPSLQ